jgi:transposase
MFWGSFYGSIKAGSVFWEKKWGTITQHTYKEHIIPLLVETTTEHSGLLFMQDNAPAHAAKSVIQELKRLGITVMTWPAYSPDLNPIETLWNWMKDWIHWHYTEDQLKNSYDKLKQAVYNAWNAIPESLLASIIDTMHERCQDVINADGGHTKW